MSEAYAEIVFHYLYPPTVSVCLRLILRLIGAEDFMQLSISTFQRANHRRTSSM